MSLTYEEQLESKEWKNIRQRILKRDGNKCSMCGKKKHLNVHHKYYILGHLAWEYDDDTFITLCQDCHEKVHKVSKIVAYKDDRMTIVNTQLTPCYRCGGTGYFPEYKHIQYGICFRCKGACFEEFLEETDKKEYEVVKSTKEEWGIEDNIDDYDFEPIGYDEEYEQKIIEDAFRKKKILIRDGYYAESGIPAFRIEYAKDSQEFDEYGVLYDTKDKRLIKSYLPSGQYFDIHEGEVWRDKSLYKIKEGTKIIDKRAFNQQFYFTENDDGFHYYGFNKIIIPNSVEIIEENAFNSENISVLVISEGLKKIGDYAFASTSIETFTLPINVLYVGESIFANCVELRQIRVSPNNKHFNSRNECNAIINTCTNSIVASCSTTKIPDDVEGIDAGAFEGVCMDTLVIPQSVMWIDYNAFKDCKIAKLYLPDTIKQIHNDWYDYDYNAEVNEIHMPLSMFKKHIEAFVKWHDIIKIDDDEIVIDVVPLDEFIKNTSISNIKVFDNKRILFTDENNFRLYAKFSYEIKKENRNEKYLQERSLSFAMVTFSIHDWTKSFIIYN